MSERFLIAQIGRTVGLHGDLKLHLYTDFPEQFKKGATFQSSKGKLQIAAYNPTRGTVRFVGFEDVDSAKRLTNVKLFSDEAATREACKLEEGQHFWFEIISCELFEAGERLGHVVEIERLVDADYLLVESDEKLRGEKGAKRFLIPYIDRYIVEVDTAAKRIEVRDAKAIFEAS